MKYLSIALSASIFTFAAITTTNTPANAQIGLFGGTALIIHGKVSSTKYKPRNEAPKQTYIEYKVCNITPIIGTYKQPCLTFGNMYGSPDSPVTPNATRLQVGSEYVLFLINITPYGVAFTRMKSGVFLIKEGYTYTYDGTPVTSIGVHGIKTGKITTTSDQNGVKFQNNGHPITLEEFKTGLRQVADYRLKNGLRVPKGLPKGWRILSGDEWNTPPEQLQIRKSE